MISFQRRSVGKITVGEQQKEDRRGKVIMNGRLLKDYYLALRKLRVSNKTIKHNNDKKPILYRLEKPKQLLVPQRQTAQMALLDKTIAKKQLETTHSKQSKSKSIGDYDRCGQTQTNRIKDKDRSLVLLDCFKPQMGKEQMRFNMIYESVMDSKRMRLECVKRMYNTKTWSKEGQGQGEEQKNKKKTYQSVFVSNLRR